VEFAFVSGNAALDLVGTLQWRRTLACEQLGGPDDLRRWIGGSGLLTDGPSVTDAELARARELREAVHRLLRDRIDATTFDVDALAVVNDWAARPGRRIALGDDGEGASGDVAAVLADLARSAITVLADRDLSVKECGRRDCTRIYVDRSRGARRTWCGMEECGNRVKAAAYRARRRG
jgi:predicted RNA-binding Zn ribbon-like protein